MKLAAYQEQLDGGRVRCLLCPHECLVVEGRRGLCNVRENRGGELYSLNYFKMGALAIDPIEKKPLYHFHPGDTIHSIGSFGCNLSCDFCQNYGLVGAESLCQDFTLEGLLSWLTKNPDVGLAYTYNEPTVWFETVREIMPRVREKGLSNVWVTNGYIQESPLAEVLPYMDAMNIDMKCSDEEISRQVTGADPKYVWRTISLAIEAGVHVEVTRLVIPGVNDSPEEIEALARKLASLNEDTALHLSRYFPSFKRKTPAPSLESLRYLQKIAKRHLKHVYLGNV